mmetsp:Transcript_33661/g.99932  ORF Transcript_33661/g.99932 Transcript_33661/m.99932 type:complete len:313 (+) Transcript_33661:67-1005(+)
MAVKRSRSSALALAVASVALGLCSWSSGPFQPALVGAAATEATESSSTIKDLVAGSPLAAAAVFVLVSVLATKQEPPPPVPAPVPVEKRVDLNRVAVIAVLLSFISGMVNATAILQMGGTVAHHTGNASHAGRLAGVDGTRFAVLMVCYFLGAGVTGYRKASGENPLCGKASPALLGVAIAVAGGGIIHWAAHDQSHMALNILSFSQGIFNGVTSKFSSMPLRTTHMTGTLTDTGAACGAWVRAQMIGDAPAPPANKTAFLLSTLAAFSFGGVVAKMACDRIGSLAVLPPAALLAVIALGVIPFPGPDGKKA